MNIEPLEPRIAPAAVSTLSGSLSFGSLPAARRCLSRLLRLVLAALLLTAAPPRADAVILMVVLDVLELFEIEGVDFTSYATSQRAAIRVVDTEDGFEGRVDCAVRRNRSAT